MSNLPNLRDAARRIPYVSLLLVAVAVGLQLCPSLLERLQYDRAAIAAGEVWRILSCHLTHCSFDHLVWDAGVLLVLGCLCELDDRRRWLRCVIATAVGIPAALWVLMPGLETYRGLSGIDSALFVMLAVSILKHRLASGRRLWAGATTVLLCGFMAKTAYEYLTAQTLFVDSAASNMVPIPLAHIVGGVVGAACVHRSRRSRYRTGSEGVRHRECTLHVGKVERRGATAGLSSLPSLTRPARVIP